MKPKRSNTQKSVLSHGRTNSISLKSSGSHSGNKKQSDSHVSRNSTLIHHSSANNNNNSSIATSKTFVHYTCKGCKKPIKRDKFLLKSCNNYWHEDCLRCDRCHGRLGELGSTLYTKSSMNLCRKDYLELFGETGVCSVCEKLICATEMVMRAKQNVYHLECFACQMCNERFCVGDRFYLCENKIICQYDFEEHILPIQESMIAQNEALSYYSRDNQTSNMNPTKEQQCFSLLNIHQDEQQQSNEQCQTNSNIFDHLNESYEGGEEREQNSGENYHNLMSVQQRDTELNAILTRYTQLDDFRAVKRLEKESMAAVVETEPEAVAAGTSEAAPKKSIDSSSKHSSKKSSSKSSLSIESLFCNHDNDNNESLINNNIRGVDGDGDGDGDDDNTTSVAIKWTENDDKVAN